MPETKLTRAEFLRKAIIKLRTVDAKGQKLDKPYTGIHYPFSGVGGAIESYFPGTKAKEVIDEAVKAGEICINGTKGGIRLYLPEDAPKTSEKVLGMILAD